MISLALRTRPSSCAPSRNSSAAERSAPAGCATRAQASRGIVLPPAGVLQCSSASLRAEKVARRADPFGNCAMCVQEEPPGKSPPSTSSERTTGAPDQKSTSYGGVVDCGAQYHRIDVGDREALGQVVPAWGMPYFDATSLVLSNLNLSPRRPRRRRCSGLRRGAWCRMRRRRPALLMLLRIHCGLQIRARFQARLLCWSHRVWYHVSLHQGWSRPSSCKCLCSRETSITRGRAARHGSRGPGGLAHDEAGPLARAAD